MMSADHQIQVAKVAADTLSAGTILAAFGGFLPPFAAMVAALWYVIQIWESDTVRGYLHRHHVIARRRSRNKARRHKHVHEPHLEDHTHVHR